MNVAGEKLEPLWNLRHLLYHNNQFRQKLLCHGFVVVSNNWGTTSNNLRSSEEDFLDDCSTNHKNKSRQQNNNDKTVCSTQK